jgi:hypothetical protein
MMQVVATGAKEDWHLDETASRKLRARGIGKTESAE